MVRAHDSRPSGRRLGSHLVVEFNGAGDGLGKGELGGLGDNSGELVPFFLGDVLGDQAVCGLDIGEFCHGSENKQTNKQIKQ